MKLNVNKSVYFSSPELFNDETSSINTNSNINYEKCDVFSLGMVCFKMLCLDEVKLEDVEDWNN